MSLKSFIEEEQEHGDDREEKVAVHPEVEAFLKYYRGELSLDEAARLQSHFYHCHTCRNLYLSLVRPSAFEGGEEQRNLQRAWERFQDSLSR
jgi:hypothetical protein